MQELQIQYSAVLPSVRPLVNYWTVISALLKHIELETVGIQRRVKQANGVKAGFPSFPTDRIKKHVLVSILWKGTAAILEKKQQTSCLVYMSRSNCTLTLV